MVTIEWFWCRIQEIMKVPTSEQILKMKKNVKVLKKW